MSTVGILEKYFTQNEAIVLLLITCQSTIGALKAELILFKELCTQDETSMATCLELVRIN